jgi:outer membrane protein assembly factor BamB
VVVGSDDGRLYVLDLASGERRWAYDVGEAIAASPAFAGGLILIGAEDGVLYAFGR